MSGGVLAGAVLVTATGCRRRQPAGTGAAPSGDLLVVEVPGGALTMLDTVTGRTVVPAVPAVLSGDGSRVVGTERSGGGTRLVSRRLPGATPLTGGTVDDGLAVRAVSPDGTLVALTSGPARDPYRPVPRARTTIVVAGPGDRRRRYDLAGNLEPEAFDVTGRFLFVLDYLPPTAPDRYRVRAVDLTSGRPIRLQTRAKSAVPPGAEEEMRGQGRQAVYDPARRLLFTLYTHQPDHRHTRDLLAGARPGVPHVHAFVHTLSLAERWAFCIDLPAPFGEHGGAHAIASSPDGGRLHVVDAAAGATAVLDPDALAVVSTTRFAAPAGTVAATAAAVTADGRLVVGAGRQVTVVGGGPTWRAGAAVRGLAPTPDGRYVHVGQDGAVVCHELATGRVVHRVAVPGLVSLHRLAAAR